MAFCQRCGGELPAAARFCPTCGRPVEPEVGPPAPPPAASIWAGLRLPGWATADWALVGLGAAVLLGLLFAASALLGLVTAVAVAGDFKAAPCGAAVGSHLAFAAFGARAAAACGGEHGAALAVGFLPLPWALAGGLATDAALRFAWRRLPDDHARRLTYTAKLAVASGVVLGLLAGVVAQGDPENRGTGFASSLNGGEVWFYSTVLIWFWGWLALRRRGVRVLTGVPGRVGASDGPDGNAAPGAGKAAGSARLARVARDGALLFAGLAGVLAVLGLLVALVVTDGVHERIGLLFGFPVVGFSFGAALLDGTMGAALGGVSGHTSLSNFGMPAGPEAGAAPVWVFLTVLLAPAAVGATVWRRLERERPAEEQGALSVGAATAVGFAASAWLAALVGRIVLLAVVLRVSELDRAFPGSRPLGSQFPAGERVGTLISLRPNPAAVLGLALLWGLIGGLGAAFLWAARHNARWQISGSGGGTNGGTPPPETPPRPPAPGEPPPAPPVPPTEVLPPSPVPPTEVVPPTQVAPPAPTPPPAAGSSAWLLPENQENQDAGAAEEPPAEKP